MSHQRLKLRLLLSILHLLFAAGLGLAFVSNATSQTPDRVAKEFQALRSLYDGPGGATCQDFLGGLLRWQRRGGDWRDARGTPYGSLAVAQATPNASVARWNVTALVKAGGAGGGNQVMFMLRTITGSGYVHFHSRESRQSAMQPLLILHYADGSPQVQFASADTNIDCSTAYSLGRQDRLLASLNHPVVMAFNLPADFGRRKLDRAELVITPISPPSGEMAIGVFELAAPELPLDTVRHGLAKQYPLDQGIDSHPQVVFAARFDDSDGPGKGWRKESHGDMAVVATDPGRAFVPLDRGALRIRVRKGEHLGSDLRLKLRDRGPEPDEVFVRYYLRFADDWRPTSASGKLPGLAGTYDKAGWGGRASDGSEGWSLRGSFFQAFEPGHPFAEYTQLGTYAYHAAMKGAYGDIWPWTGALLKRNRWYCVEQQVRLNQVGAKDGILRVWIDGRQVFEDTRLQLRTQENIRIETAWFNIYYGGLETAPQDMSLYIDNVVVSKAYVGPIAGLVGIPAPNGR